MDGNTIRRDQRTLYKLKQISRLIIINPWPALIIECRPNVHLLLLLLFLFATNVLFLRPLSLSLSLPSPVITSTNIQAIAFPWSNSRAHRAATRQIRWNRPVNTASKRRRLSLFETVRISPTPPSPSPFLPLRLPLRLRLLSLVGYPRLFASSFGRSHFVLCSTYVSRVRNNAKDRGGMRRGSSVGEALLLIVLTGGIFELERARREREMDGLSVCGWGRGSVRVEMEMKRCCCFLLDCDSLPRLLFDVILL